ncbi:MAG: ATP-dependent Clp protease proteolytic subunit [Clostridia bacterium]|nr:ATP-dependent Clp protease proteolytic subunit [Clostridia bacterium]
MNTEKRKNTEQDGDGENESTRLQQRLQMVEDNGSVTTDNGNHRIHCMTIVGQIEGHYVLPIETKSTKYEHMIPQLVAVDESREIEGLLILLNTVGGDVEAGLALAELIAGMKKPTVSLVLGGGHSIGVPLAVAADRSFIVPSATMTIHPVRTNGLVLGVPQAFTHFQRMQERIVDFVCRHSDMTSERFFELCMTTGEMATDVGSVLNGEEAVDEGLIDRLGSLRDAIDALYQMIENTAKGV